MALNVPIGVIEADWGATPAEVWMQREFLQANPRYKDEVFGEWVVAEDNYERSLAAYIKAKPRRRRKEWSHQCRAVPSLGAG